MQVENTIRALLQGKSVTFAGITYATEVKPAAAHKARKIVKRTGANVQLFSNINAATSVFSNAVKRSASQVAGNDAANVEAFQAQSNYFEHTDCYSIVKHKTNGKLYLYCIYNSAQSEYEIDGVPATKQDVAALLTPSAAQQLLAPSKTTVNKTYNVAHEVAVHTIALDNILSINAAKQQVVF